MKNILNSIFGLVFLSAIFANAETYTLRNNGTGSVFTCTAGGGGVTPVSPQCVTDMNNLCDWETSFSDEQCFSKSTRACSAQVTVACVKEINQSCDWETNYSDEQCFDESILACGGNAQSLRALMQASREKAVADARASFPK